jgi:hypothetical protein
MRTHRSRFRPCVDFRPSLDSLPPRIAPSDIATMIYLDGSPNPDTGTEVAGDPGTLPLSPIWTGPCQDPAPAGGVVTASTATSLTPVVYN